MEPTQHHPINFLTRFDLQPSPAYRKVTGKGMEGKWRLVMVHSSWTRISPAADQLKTEAEQKGMGRHSDVVTKGGFSAYHKGPPLSPRLRALTLSA